jgi:hypothetical protein
VVKVTDFGGIAYFPLISMGLKFFQDFGTFISGNYSAIFLNVHDITQVPACV